MFPSMVLNRCLRALIVAACLLVPILGAVGASANEGGGQVAVRDVLERNELIAAQESLLNVYRCRFNVDIWVVPDGCIDGQPLAGPTEPDPFDGTPTENDAAARDELIAAQESLLNDYRCLFRIDMDIVPGGCHRLAVAASGAIWTLHGDGADLVELVVAPSVDDRYSHSGIWDISWSPDGKHIAYSLSYIRQGDHVRTQIWIVGADGLEHNLVLEIGEHPFAYLSQITWSPDGSQLYYLSHCCDLQSDSYSTQLWRVDVDGTNNTLLTDASSYSWSPDYSQIVYRKLANRILGNGESYTVSQTWIMNANGDGQRKIRDDGGSFGPVWSPDGSAIAIETVMVDEDNYRSKELSVFNSEGRHRRLLDNIPYELAHANDSRKTGFSWSPSSDQIVYLDHKGQEDVLTLIDIEGSGKRPLTSLGRAATFPVWSLDGTRIAFAPATAEPNEDGNSYTGGGLWTIKPDGTNLHLLTPGHWYISAIAWSPTR